MTGQYRHAPIVCADVAGYGRLMDQDESGPLEATHGEVTSDSLLESGSEMDAVAAMTMADRYARARGIRR
jgi:hypothetical protein